LNELAGTWFIVVKPDNLKWKNTSIKKGGEWEGPKWNPIHTGGADIWLFLG
jgi:hypothetical protein